MNVPLRAARGRVGATTTLASPQISFGVRLSRIHFSPTDRPWGRNEYVTNKPQRTSAGRLLPPATHAVGLNRSDTSYRCARERMLPVCHDATKLSCSCFNAFLIAAYKGFSFLSFESEE